MTPEGNARVWQSIQATLMRDAPSIAVDWPSDGTMAKSSWGRDAPYWFELDPNDWKKSFDHIDTL
jgi:hypothetical protein